MIALSRDSPLRSVWISLRQRQSGGGGDKSTTRSNLVFVCLGAGILLSGYLCFAVGSILALEATRALVKAIGGYRSEWIRFLNDQVHREYRRCKSATSPSPATSKRLKHPLTGGIDGYRVEYAYKMPCSSYSSSDKGNIDDKTRTRRNMVTVRRTILVDKSRPFTTTTGNINHDSATAMSSEIISYYRNEGVRSLAEYLQRKKCQRKQQRILESYRSDDSDDSEDDSSEDSSDDSSHDNDEESRNTSRKRNKSREEKNSSDNNPDGSYLVPISTSINKGTPDSIQPYQMGVPYGYWIEKRRELLLWTELIEPGIAFFGINFYLALSFLHALLTCPVKVRVVPSHSSSSTRAFTEEYLQEAQRKQEYELEHNFGDDDEEDQLCYNHVRRAMVWAVVAIALMIPYCLLEARALQRSRFQSWKHDCDLLDFPLTEFERIRNALRWLLYFGQEGFKSTEHGSWNQYCTKQALYAPMFLCGTLLLWLACGPQTLLFGYGAVYCMVQWINDTLPIKKEVLKNFRDNPKARNDIVATAHLASGSEKAGRKQRHVTIEYKLSLKISSRGKNKTKVKSTVIVSKDIESAELYRDCAKASSTITVPIHLHPRYPLSGYPTVQLERDISNSWSLIRWQIVCFVTIGCYIYVAMSDLELDLTGGYYEENPFDERDFWTSALLMMFGPLLLLPGALIMREIQHDQFLLNTLYEPKRNALMEMVEH